ncbi:hypothetical protein GCM10008090_27510 [Arenicella chitinivorans]|uniref:Protein kinase domain-containing protein n=1 Tax=Arenicella chitinivorans TaxID=1329800 RepID=A0A918S0B7_9GAMM|nr:serine/threonine-protein kinase [Arenicella chitinivorans]GHA16204.1 hypothetical protein GCM10008090_27510 [Arenicella chitinivorans]
MTNDELEEIFHSALERAANEREKFVRNATQTDADFKFIWNLISKADKQTQFMATSYAVEDSPTALNAGDIVGNWLVQELLGRGGMGEVYRVSRIYPDFEQFGALKISRSPQQDLVARFHNERRILAQLEHPNIGRLIDAGVLKNGLPFMVTELVDGIDILDYVADNALTFDTSLQLFTQLCDAIAHAHERHILHRDIKPSNVLVNRAGQVKLIDFGVSGFLKRGEAKSAPFTKAFAAPEQATGHRLDESTDIFALGKLLSVLVYETKPVATALSKTPRSLRELGAICDKCTRDNPQDRYRSVKELTRELQCYADKKPIQAMHGDWRYVLQKYFQRHRWLVAGACLVTLSVSGAGIAYLSATDKTLRAKTERRTIKPVVDLPSDRIALGCDQSSIGIFSDTVTTGGELTSEQRNLVSLARDHVKQGLGISALSFTPDCQGIALVTQSTQHTTNVRGSLPVNFHMTLQRLLGEGKKVTAIAFDPYQWEQRAAFVIAYEGGYEASPDTSSELLKRLKSATDTDGAVAAIAFFPLADRPSGWSVLGANGFQYTRNVTKQNTVAWYYENLRFLKRHAVVPTFASFSADGEDYVLGNAQCVYSSRTDLLQLTDCPSFTPQ